MGESKFMGTDSSYSPFKNVWNRQWPGRISRHDLVYLSPLEDPILGMPIGNGDIGALVWTESGKLIFAVNKCDLWDVNTKRSTDKQDEVKDEDGTCLRHCGRLVIDFNMPVFDVVYLDDFNGRLDLPTATCKISSKTPFAEVNAEAFISYKHKVIIIKCELYSEESPETDVIFERWGSRTFAMWYNNITRDASIGLEGTNSKFEDNMFLLSQKLNTMEFVVGIKIFGEQIEQKLIHKRAGKFSVKGKSKKIFNVILTVATSDEADNPEEYVKTILTDAANAGVENIRQQHENEWKNFWDKSFISIPDDYIENLWYLNLYYANSSSRGKYPPHFCNGIWGFNRDFVPWKDYFHWNMQWYVWPLQAADHSDLAKPYFEYRKRQLPNAVEYAKKIKNKKGAFYTDVSDSMGFSYTGIKDNNTPGAQIAMDFWRQYQYTQDREFLEKEAWPVIYEVTCFYADMVTKSGEGRYHIESTQAYEGSSLFDDTITDIAMIKALFPVAIQIAGFIQYENRSEIERWREIEQKIADFILVPLEEREYVNIGGKTILNGGLGKGKEIETINVFGVGKSRDSKAVNSTTKENVVRDRFAGDKDTAYYGIPDPELAPVFPAGVIGLKDKGTEQYYAAVNQVCLHPDPVSDDMSKAISGERDNCMGWCPYPVVLSRLGLSKELINTIRSEISYWQCYCQGFGHYAPYSVFTKDNNLRWHTHSVKDNRTGEIIDFPAWPFRHFDNETIPILCTAVNEMLLQSYEGRIRLFPALPEDWNVSFKLAAAGGFIVHAEAADGRTKWFSIDSRHVGKCIIVNPWEEIDVTYCIVFDPVGNELAREEFIPKKEGNDCLIEFNTLPGHRYLFLECKDILSRWNTIEVNFKANSGCKKLGNAQLGLPKLF